MSDRPTNQTTKGITSAEVAALRKIVDHWGSPMPLGTSHKTLIRSWMRNYQELKNIARTALGEPPHRLPDLEDE